MTTLQESAFTTSLGRCRMEELELKYATDLRQIPECPPSAAVPCVRKAFRFVHEDVSDCRNFSPVAKINPRRILQGSKPHGRCIAFALSFYASKEQAITAFNNMLARQQNFWKTVGDRLATGQLSGGDGVALGVSNDGHFSFFESLSADFSSSRFTVIERLR